MMFQIINKKLWPIVYLFLKGAIILSMIPSVLFAKCPEIILSENELGGTADESFSELVDNINSLNSVREESICLGLKINGNNIWKQGPIITIINSKQVPLSSVIKLPIPFMNMNGDRGFLVADDYRDLLGNIVIKWISDNVLSISGLPHTPMEIIKYPLGNGTLYRTILDLSTKSDIRGLHKIKISELARAKGISHLTHSTPCDNVLGIIKKQGIFSGKNIGKANFDLPQKFSKVFLQLESSNQFTNEKRVNALNCTLYFSLDILDEGPYFINNSWGYGAFSDSSVQFTDRKRILILLRKITHNGNIDSRGVSLNEVVIRGSLSLNHLLYISVPKERPDLINKIKKEIFLENNI